VAQQTDPDTAVEQGLLHELVPAATRIGLLINPENANAEDQARELRAKAWANSQPLGPVAWDD
jgi:ABC-type uncharacterized transport system substrate-binding protein